MYSLETPNQGKGTGPRMLDPKPYFRSCLAYGCREVGGCSWGYLYTFLIHGQNKSDLSTPVLSELLIEMYRALCKHQERRTGCFSQFRGELSSKECPLTSQRSYRTWGWGCMLTNPLHRPAEDATGLDVRRRALSRRQQEPLTGLRPRGT